MKFYVSALVGVIIKVKQFTSFWLHVLGQNLSSPLTTGSVSVESFSRNWTTQYASCAWYRDRHFTLCSGSRTFTRNCLCSDFRGRAKPLIMLKSPQFKTFIDAAASKQNASYVTNFKTPLLNEVLKSLPKATGMGNRCEQHFQIKDCTHTGTEHVQITFHIVILHGTVNVLNLYCWTNRICTVSYAILSFTQQQGITKFIVWFRPKASHVWEAVGKKFVHFLYPHFLPLCKYPPCLNLHNFLAVQSNEQWSESLFWRCKPTCICAHPCKGYGKGTVHTNTV